MCYAMYFVCSTDRVKTRTYHLKIQEQEVSNKLLQKQCVGGWNPLFKKLLSSFPLFFSFDGVGLNPH
jgi:hypothetical protein